MQVQVNSHEWHEVGWNCQRTIGTCTRLADGILCPAQQSYGADCCWIWCVHTVCRAWRRRSARERHAAAAWMLFGAASSRGLWDKSRRSHPGRLEMMEMGQKRPDWKLGGLKGGPLCSTREDGPVYEYEANAMVLWRLARCGACVIVSAA